MSSTGVSRITGVDPSVAIKAPCKVATSGNITLSGAQTVNGVALTETTPKTRVLVRAQTASEDNGIYDVYDTAWQRSDDFNGSRDVVDGTLVTVEDGSLYSGSTWRVSASNPIAIGTTAIEFVRTNNFEEAIISVATFSDLATTQATNGQLIRTTEYRSGSGKGGSLYLGKTGTATVGNYQQSASGTVGVYWQEYADKLDPFTLGAYGDNTNDDTDVIEWMFNSEKPFEAHQGNFKCDPITISGKRLEGSFTGGARLSFDQQGSDSLTFYQCTGRIDGLEIYDTAESVAGIYITCFMHECEDFHLNYLHTIGGKDLPVVMMDCDYTIVYRGIGEADGSNIPFAWEVIGCKLSGFEECRLYDTLFGHLLIGPGYKSGEARLTSVRDQKDCVGMFSVRSQVERHTGHAFDMNGTVGAKFIDCVAKDYVGVSGNTSFQVKQSVNIGSEQPDDTYLNEVSGCTAINCVVGFGTQEGTDPVFTNNTVINSYRYAATFNSTKRVRLDGLKVRDFATDTASWPALNGDTYVGAIAVWSGSEDAKIDNVDINVRTDTGTLSTTSLVNVVGTGCQIGRVFLRKESGVAATLATALHITGNGCQILESCRLTPGNYTLNAIVDTTQQTIYPFELGQILDLSTANTQYVVNAPNRGLVVGRVVARTITGTTTGAERYSVGRFGSTGAIVALRSAPASGNTEYVDPVTFLNNNQDLTITSNPSAAAAGTLRVLIQGVKQA